MTMQQSRLSVAPLAGVVAVAGVAMSLAACSSSSSSGKKTASPAVRQTTMPSPGSSKSPKTPMPSGSPSLSAAACKHVKSLRGSLTSVTHVGYSGKSVTVITADLKNIKIQAAALKGEPALAPEVKSLSASVTKVENAAKGMTTPPTPAQIRAVVTALAGLKTTATPAIAKLKTACP